MVRLLVGVWVWVWARLGQGQGGSVSMGCVGWTGMGLDLIRWDGMDPEHI